MQKDSMNKIIVNHKHRYTKEEMIIYEGQAKIVRYDDHMKIKYLENKATLVTLDVYEDKLILNRKNQEITTNLLFINESDTSNTISSEYGDIEIMVHTYNYEKNEKNIIVEYDILSSGEQDGYEISFKIEEEDNEFN